MKQLSVLEICAGGGGQAIGLERAGYEHAAAIELDSNACQTLSLNRPSWNIVHRDVREVDGTDYRGIELFAAGVPCPPFSVAGKQLGSADERDLFPEALRLIEQSGPAAVMLENVRGLATAQFSEYRRQLCSRLFKLGYEPEWRVLNASEYGVPQLRPRFVLVALKRAYAESFQWPLGVTNAPTVGETLGDLMASLGWGGAGAWSAAANRIAPTLVGGSKKHGGPDLGPTRARRQWDQLGVDGLGIADAPPDRSAPLDHRPRLTLRMVARLQGFPDQWQFHGRKTAAYQQIGNAFPPPVAEAVAKGIALALAGRPYDVAIAERPRLLSQPLVYASRG